MRNEFSDGLNAGTVERLSANTTTDFNSPPTLLWRNGQQIDVSHYFCVIPKWAHFLNLGVKANHKKLETITKYWITACLFDSLFWPPYSVDTLFLYYKKK